MPRVVAITGGTGFVGRHLVARHVALGDEVRYLTRSAEAPLLPGAVRHVGDLCGPADALAKFVRGADVLYHCAAELLDASRMEQTNVDGTQKLLHVARGEIGRWVQLSSTGVYGEKRDGVVVEDTVLRPGNAYERSKAKADALVLDAATDAEFSCALLRPSNVYGADMSNRSLFQLIRMIERGFFFFIGPRGAMMNYIHIENVMDALLACGQATLSQNGRAYIVSDHCTLEAFVDIIAMQFGRRMPYLRLPEFPVRGVAAILGNIPRFPLKLSRVDALTSRAVYQSERITSELGFRNRVSLEQGLAEMVGALRRSAC